MLYSSKNKQSNDTYATPIFGITKDNYSIPKYKINENSIAPNIAYRMIKDELMNEGNARLNLATFVKPIWKIKLPNLWLKPYKKCY